MNGQAAELRVSEVLATPFGVHGSARVLTKRERGSFTEDWEWYRGKLITFSAERRR